MSDELLNETDDDTQLVRSLRAALRAANKERDELRGVNGKLAEEARSARLSDRLKQKGIDAKYAKLFPKDQPVDDETFASWLKEYEDVIPVAPAQGEAPPAEQAPPEQQGYQDPNVAEMWQRMSATTGPQAPGTSAPNPAAGLEDQMKKLAADSSLSPSDLARALQELTQRG